jgi:RND family efflux transporter MFP subunit
MPIYMQLRPLHTLALLIMPLLVWAGGCSKDASDKAPAVLVAVQVAHPVEGSIAQHVLSDAVLSPLAQAALSPRISAPVSRFYVQRGSRVKAGELLATLEHRDLAAAATDTEGSYTAAQAALATTQGAQLPQEMQSARLDVSLAKSTLDLNQGIVAARQKLFDQGAIPGRDLDTARAALAQAQAAYDIAVEHLSALESVSRKATLEQAQGAVASAHGKYLGAIAQVSYAQVRSPIAGVVTDRPLFAGETASAGTPLLTIMDTSSVLAKVHLAQSASQPLAVGDTAVVSLAGIDEPLKGTISLVSPALDPGSTTIEVWVRLDNGGGRLKVGTPVHISLAGRTIEHALVIPATALLKALDGGRYVMLLGDDGAAHRRRVIVGIVDGEQAQILSGVTAKDTVIIGGAYGLDDGTKVKVGSGDAGPGTGKDQ